MPFNFNKCTITARPLTIADDDAATEIGMMARPSPDSPLQVRHMTFAEFQVAAEVTDDKGTPVAFTVPHVTASDDVAAVKAAYEAWRSLPRTFPRQWLNELNAVESAAKNGSASPS